MKKLAIFILVLVTLTTATGAFAECYTGPAEIALSAQHNMVGAIYPCEALTLLGPQTIRGKNYIRNILENGIVREKALIWKFDLSTVHVMVAISPKYFDFVKLAVANSQGVSFDEAKMTAGTIIEATHYYCGEFYVGHMFMTSNKRVRVGSVSFEDNPGEFADLFIADFDGDGNIELGFAPGYRQTENKVCRPITVWVCR